MSRPYPLKGLTATGRTSDYVPLTPRTPHSRAGLAEEAFEGQDYDGLDEVELERDADYRSHRQQQVEPLLTSSASASFPPSGSRNRGDDYDEKTATAGKSWKSWLKYAPLAAGIMVGGALLGTIILSLRRPDIVEGFIGLNATTPTGASKGSTGGMQMPDTISYANYSSFPLTGPQYRYECGELNKGYMHMGEYWSVGNHSLDVPHADEARGYTPVTGEQPVCNSTITYLLDGHVGLLASLALMAQTAALARERNRTFLVDDTHWNRGKWTDHFMNVRDLQPGPEPNCKAPPPEELVACPRSARHWVVTSSTAKWHLGHSFSNHYDDSYGRGLNRLKPAFEFAVTSFKETIIPNSETMGWIQTSRKELGMQDYIGVHVRRGDRKSTSWKYHGAPVPSSEFITAIDETWPRFLPKPHNERVIYLASDCPEAESEIINLLPQSTTVYSLRRSEDMDKREFASPQAYNQTEFNAWDEEKRVKATTGMIIDFALLNGMWSTETDKWPEATICTITSTVCRLSAVGLGWERAFGDLPKIGDYDIKEARWVEIDSRGSMVPEWEAFELFN